jgi:hypothetical protein
MKKVIRFKEDYIYLFKDTVRNVESVFVVEYITDSSYIFAVRTKEIYPQIGRTDDWERILCVDSDDDTLMVIGHKDDYPEYFV